MSKNHKGEAVIYALLSSLFAVLSIPAVIYALSFEWVDAGLFGFVFAGFAIAVCCMPLWFGYATHQRWHGKEVSA